MGQEHKEKFEKSSKILKEDQEMNPLPELSLLIKTNSQSKIFLEMVFSRCKALEVLLPQLIINIHRRRRQGEKDKIEEPQKFQIRTIDHNSDDNTEYLELPVQLKFVKFNPQSQKLNPEKQNDKKIAKRIVGI